MFGHNSVIFDKSKKVNIFSFNSLASSTEGRDAAVDTDSGVEVNPSPVKGE